MLRPAEAKMIPTANHLIRLMSGIGDAFFQRPIIRELLKQTSGGVWIKNDWPQLWHDLPVHVLPSDTNLRTQSENRHRSKFSEPPAGPTRIRATTYTPSILQQNPTATILDVLADMLSVALPDVLDHSLAVPADWLWKPDTSKPVAVVRPPTVRREWPAPARNPDPAAFNACVGRLMETHHVVSVAHSDPIDEPLVEPIEAHERYERGELTIEQVIGLIAESDVVLAGVGFALPLCGAIGARCFILHGGCLGCNAPNRTMDPRCDWSSVGVCMPDELCGCYDRQHECAKRTEPARAVSELAEFLIGSASDGRHAA